MAVAKARFPRTAYARRADTLARELNEWVISLRELALGPDRMLVHPKARQQAEGRAYACEHAQTIAEALVAAIEGIR